MKKTILSVFLLASFAMTIIGCKKDDEDSTPQVTENTWSIDGTSYTLGNSIVKPSFNNGTVLSVFGADGNLLTIDFAEKPTSSGAYAVKSPVDDLTGNQCVIYATKADGTMGTIYYSTGRSGDVVNVTMVDGKVKAIGSNIQIETQSGGSALQASLSLNLLEN